MQYLSAIFSQKSYKNKHFVHEKRKTFECRVCRKKFSNNGNLKKHANALHEENGMIFKYALCAKYKKNDSLTYHISRIHEGLKPLKCEICVAYFTSK